MGSNNIILLHGEEKYLLNNFLEGMRNNVSMPEINLHSFEGDLIEQKVIAAMEQLPFCSEMSLVVVKSNFKGVSDFFIDCIKEIPSTTKLLLAYDGNVDKRTKFYKTIKKVGSIKEFNKLSDSSLHEFISNEVEKRNAKISDDAINLLVMRMGYLQKEKTDVNLYSVINYIDKLVNYTNEINEDIVEKLVDESPEENAFKLMDMLTSSKIHLAFKYANGLIEGGNNPLALIALITRHFRILLKLHLVDDPNILGLHPFVLGNMKGQVKNYSEEDLFEILKLCLDSQRKIKTGKLSSVLALENLLVSISNSSK